MNKEAIRRWDGVIRGWIEEDSKGNKTIRDFYGRILGRYDKQLNLTRDFYGRVIGRGDQLMSLLED